MKINFVILLLTGLLLTVGCTVDNGTGTIADSTGVVKIDSTIISNPDALAPNDISTGTNDTANASSVTTDVDTSITDIDTLVLRNGADKEWSDLHMPIEIGKELLDGEYTVLKYVSSTVIAYEREVNYTKDILATLNAGDTINHFHHLKVVSDLKKVTIEQSNREERVGYRESSAKIYDLTYKSKGYASGFVPEVISFTDTTGISYEVCKDIQAFLPRSDMYLTKDVYVFPNFVYRKFIATEGNTMWVFKNLDGMHIYENNANTTNKLTDTLNIKKYIPGVSDSLGIRRETVREYTDLYFNNTIKNVYDTITYSIVCDTGSLAMEYGLKEQLNIIGKVGVIMVSEDNKGKNGNWYASYTYSNSIGEVFSKTIKLTINPSGAGYLLIKDNSSVAEYNVTLNGDQIVSYSGKILFTYKMYGGDGENSRNLLKLEEFNEISKDEFDPFILENEIFW